MKVVAYYRTRPSEPVESDQALRAQREAVLKDVEDGGYTLVAEFIEREGEEDGKDSPAYFAAVRTALSHKGDEDVLDVMLLVASCAGIGSGEAFQQPPWKGCIGSCTSI